MRNPAILFEIEVAENILITNGVRDFCIACINSAEGGCCHGCSALSDKGCTIKPLSCSLWLCYKAEKKFPEVANKLNAIKRKYPYELSQGHRLYSIKIEEKLYAKSLE